jgi:hypothetical protein
VKQPKVVGYHFGGRVYCTACSPTNEPRKSLWSDNDALPPETRCENCDEDLTPPRKHERTCRCMTCTEARACQAEDRYDAVRRGEW